MAEDQVADPAVDNPQSGNAPGGSVLTGGSIASPAQPATDARPAWMDQLQPDLKADVGLTKFKTVTDLGKSYKELEGKLGTALIPPGEGASDEEVRSFWQKLGTPDSPDKYSLDTVKGNAEFEKNFRAWSHELHLTQSQASSMYAKYAAGMAEQAKASREELAATAAQTRSQLEADWGPDFKQNLAYMERAFQRFNGTKAQEAIIKSGLGNNADVCKMFALIGAEMREDPILSSRGGNAATKTDAEVLYGSASS